MCFSGICDILPGGVPGRLVGETSAMRALRRLLATRPVLLLAFAFAVMGDPVSSVAYAIEAALRALDGRLALLLPTMALVVAIIGLVIANYHRLVARFPGGGDAAAAGTAFGEGWAFLPLGALIVDYALTIAISVAAAASAVIAYQPSLGGCACRSRSSCSPPSPASPGSATPGGRCSRS